MCHFFLLLKNIKNVLFTNFLLLARRWTFFNLFSGLSSVFCGKLRTHSLVHSSEFFFFLLLMLASRTGKIIQKNNWENEGKKTWNVSEVESRNGVAVCDVRREKNEKNFLRNCGNGEHPVELIQLWSFLVLSHSNL